MQQEQLSSNSNMVQQLMRYQFIRFTRTLFRLSNRFLNNFGILLSKPEVIHGSPAFSGATTWARRLYQTRYFFDLIANVHGDVAESGVHWGYGLLIEFFLIGKGEGRRIYGFDSFSGHSRATNRDLAGGRYKPLDHSFRVTEDDVWKTLELGTGERRSHLREQIELIPGWIQETMPLFRARARRERIQLALVHADCDLYEPLKATLENTWEFLSKNGVIILGLLDNPELMGKTIAVREFLDTINRDEYELCFVDLAGNRMKTTRQSYLRKVKAV